MSRSSKIVSNPAELTLKFKNEKFNKKTKQVDAEAGFYYYVKPENEGEEGQNVLVPFPLKFIWIEDAQSVSGFNKKENTGVYSNEILTNPANKLVKKYGKKPLVVKVRNEEIAKGEWNDIKEVVKANGGKYCVPVYALAEIDGEWKLVRILMSGGSRDSWFTISKNRTKVENNIIVADGFEEVETPTGDTYQKPAFKFGEAISGELNDKVDEATEAVDEYFSFVLSDEASEDQVLATADADVEGSDY